MFEYREIQGNYAKMRVKTSKRQSPFVASAATTNECPIFLNDTILMMMMTTMMRGYSLLWMVFLLLTPPVVEAFTVAPRTAVLTLTTTTRQQQQQQQQKRSSLLLLAGKKPSSDKKETQAWDLNLLILFMTPWKNPNSIFVYMLGLLYVLGTISEARSAAGGP